MADGVWQRCYSQPRTIGRNTVGLFKLMDQIQKVIGVDICLKGGWKRLSGRGKVSYLFLLRKIQLSALIHIRLPFPSAFLSDSVTVLAFLIFGGSALKVTFFFPEVEGEAMTAFGCVDDGSGGAGGASWCFRLGGHR